MVHDSGGGSLFEDGLEGFIIHLQTANLVTFITCIGKTKRAHAITASNSGS
jgi:hypothetical protein